MQKVHRAKPGETKVPFVFTVTNTGAEPVKISAVLPACGCTVATMPASPWVVAPGASGSFTAQLDFVGKQGVLTKTLTVESDRGDQVLTVVVEIPETDEVLRQRNQELARANRQLVFQGECARCHVEPLAGLKGAELFPGACGICHSAPKRAPMVPDLQIAKTPRDAAYWRQWIAQGKEGTLMPGFAQAHGGPLSEEQIESLVEYALANLPTQPKVIPLPGGSRPLPVLPKRKEK